MAVFKESPGSGHQKVEHDRDYTLVRASNRLLACMPQATYNSLAKARRQWLWELTNTRSDRPATSDQPL